MPNDKAVQNPDGTWTVFREAGGQATYRNTDELKRERPDLLMASQALKDLDLDVLCRDELHPIQPGAIEVGDLVFVRAAKQFGEVHRKVGDAFRVCMRGSGRVETRWGLELERRA